MYDNSPGHELPPSMVASPERPGSSRLGDTCEYWKARELILELGIASHSWLQRQLGLTRGEAVRHINRMQDEGFVSLADHLGRRAIHVIEEER